MTVQAALSEIDRLPHKEDGRVYIGHLNKLIPQFRKNNDLALALWLSGNPNARELAVRIADPQAFPENKLDIWLGDLNEWGLCDAFTGHLVAKMPCAENKVFAWCAYDGEYQKRAGFALIAQMAWAKNDFADDFFIKALVLVKQYAADDRYYVRKAVNWALRDIGKRNDNLRLHAQKLAFELQNSPDKAARWIGTHRIKEIS